MEKNSRYPTVICVTGPESSGKTTLATQLSEYFNAPLVPEISREYLSKRISKGEPSYNKDDILKIAEYQSKAEKEIISHSKKIVICDTDLLVLQIWLEKKYKSSKTNLKDALKSQSKRFYLVTRPNIPWEADPLRESEHDRDKLFLLHIEYLNEMKHPFRIIDGQPQERLYDSVNIIDGWVNA